MQPETYHLHHQLIGLRTKWQLPRFMPVGTSKMKGTQRLRETYALASLRTLFPFRFFFLSPNADM